MDACVYYIYKSIIYVYNNSKAHKIGTSCIKYLYEGHAHNGGALFYACIYIRVLYISLL